MHWRSKDIWKAGIALAGLLLLLLVLMVWVPISAAGAYEGASGLATPVTGTVQEMPAVDATVTALSKEQLTLQIKQLQNQNNWLVNNSTALIAAFVTIVVALFGIYQWAGNRKDDRQKESDAHDKDLKAQAEERFKTAVAALGDEKEGTQVGGAILLRSFLNKDDKDIYERYYTQVFDLAVAYLRFPRTPNPPEDPNTPLPLTTLSRALIVVFREAFPLARSQNKGHLQSLDASTIRLDDANLSGADLKQVWMPKAFLRNADLWKANLNGADVREADLREVNLRGADLRGANLRGANLRGADLNRADLSGANLRGADLREANLNEANLRGAYLSGDLFYKATDLSFAVLSRANLAGAILKDTNLYRVKGLTDEQLEACKAKGAIIDEDAMTSASHSAVAPPLPSQSNDAQTPLAPSSQANPPTPDTGGSNTPSSKPDPES